MSDLSEFKYSTADWREQLKKNQRKTRIVIGMFIGLYLLVGFIVDLAIAESTYKVPLEQIIMAFLRLQLIPYATLIMAAIAVVSLLITYTFYDRIMLLGTEYHEITPENAQNLEEKQLYNVVEEMKVAAGLRYMPRVFIIDADYMNAFASGFSEKSAMVAITRGLLQKLNRAEMQAVMAHEISHIRHLDIKLTLTVAILSNIMLIVIDMLFYNMLSKRRRDNGDQRLFMVIVVLRYVLPIITVLLTLFLSRTREYMADAGCVELMRDNGPLARALIKINQDYAEHTEEYKQAYGGAANEDVRRAAYIFDPVKAGFSDVSSISSLFSTHPDLMQRLKALGFEQK